MAEPQVRWQERNGQAVATVRRLCASADTTPAPLADVGHDWPLVPLSTATRSDGTLVVWRNPQEWLVLGEPSAVATMLQPITPGQSAHWVGVDLSEALAVIELTGTDIAGWLCRLTDAQSLPVRIGQATGARLADTAVTLVMPEASRYWVVVERPWVCHLLGWFDHAVAAADARGSAPDR